MTSRKINWADRVSKAIEKFFAILKDTIRLACEFITRTMGLVTVGFALLLKIIAEPSTPCVVAIIAFMGISTVAALQWWAIGVWWGKMFGFSALWGMGAGLAGSLVGFGINIFQLSPQLWRLRKDVTKSYLELGVNPSFAPTEPETIESKSTHWLSFDHKNLKRARLASYLSETAIVISYCAFAQSFSLYAIVQAGVSLFLPEQSLELLSSVVSLMGAVSEQVSERESDSDQQTRRQPR